MTVDQFKLEVIPLRNKLFRYALSRVFELELAKDIAQEVIIKLWEQRSQLSQIKNIEAWAIRCVRNLSVDKLKAKHQQTVQFQDITKQEEGYHIDHHLENNDLINWVKVVSNILPDKQREIFQLRELLGYSNAEIQEILELDENQVKVNLFRARKKIRLELEKTLNYGLKA